MLTPPSEAAFGKGGILRLGFRKTGWHIAALTMEQMCHLFYLKRANVWGQSMKPNGSEDDLILCFREGQVC